MARKTTIEQIQDRLDNTIEQLDAVEEGLKKQIEALTELNKIFDMWGGAEQ